MVTDRTDLYAEFGEHRLPPGQQQTDGFPVLSKSGTPAVDPTEWTFEVFGAVADPLTLSFEELQELPSETPTPGFPLRDRLEQVRLPVYGCLVPDDRRAGGR